MTTFSLFRPTAMVVALWSLSAFAQESRIDTQLFRPPATSGGILQVDSAFVAPHLWVSGSFFAGYDRDAVTLRDAMGQSLGSMLQHRFDGQFMVSLSLFRHLEIGAALPVLFYQSVATPAGWGTLSRTALGDMRFDVKVLLARIGLWRGRQLGFGLSGSLSVPTGDTNSLYAAGGVSFRPRFLFSAHLRPLELYVQVGVLFEAGRAVGDVQISHQLDYGLATRVNVWRGFGLMGSFTGAIGFSGLTGTTPIEFLLGPEYRFRRLPFELVAAAGRGVTDGIGAPSLRIVVGLRFQPRVPIDRDSDGVFDNKDRCPDQKGSSENGGCPDLDEDSDGIIDREDRCPSVAGLRENAGCPDNDSDHDGIVDRMDQCPAVAGPVENRGCPWPDRDHDGVFDEQDKCPDVAGVRENGGCPDSDGDKDGIVDRLDKCPSESETFNGIDDTDGCPEKIPTLAVLTENAIVIKQQVFFETKLAAIKHTSFRLLAAVANILLAHPEITHVRVEGHTDSMGSRSANLKLSQARAEAVRHHLISVNGLPSERLIAQGFGPDRPIAPVHTTAGRAKNRRCEFIIVND